MKDNAIFYTASMAKLCADQGYFDKSLEIYRCLLDTDPDNDALRSALNTVEQVKTAAVDFATAEDDAPAIIAGEETDEEETIADAIEAISGAEKESVEAPKAAAAEKHDVDKETAATEAGVQGGLEPVIKKWVELMIEHDLKTKFNKIRKSVTYLQPPTV